MIHSHLSPNLILVLAYLLKTRSVGSTALALGLSQPSVSRYLAQLREVIKDPLLVRTGNGMTRTRRADELVDKLSDWVSHTAGLFDERAFAPVRLNRRFRIASTDFGTTSVLHPALAQLRRDAPGVGIDIVPLGNAPCLTSKALASVRHRLFSRRPVPHVLCPPGKLRPIWPGLNMRASHPMNKDAAQPKPRRGRPRKEEVASIDRDVLDAARSCFVAAGFDASTMEAIAAQAGVTKTTLYLRYADKESLLRAVLEDRLKAWGEASSKTDWMMGQSIDDRLRYFARTLVRLSQDAEIRSFRTLVDSLFGSNRSLGEQYKELLYRPMLDILSHEISVAAAQTGRDARNADEAAAVFLGMLSSFAFVRLSADEDAEISYDEFAYTVTEIFLRGREAW
nr:TetR family transcriptional regulator [Novosphingobium pentaromativorans]